MKSKLVLKLWLVGLALAILIPGTVMAQGGLNYQSGVQVFNLEAAMATITLTYYNQDGTVEAAVDDTIAANSSKTYFPLTGVTVGFNGSLVISSNRQITAISNLVNDSFTYGAAITSFSAGSTSFNLPLVMCNNSNFNTFFNVQNTGTADADVTVNYLPGSHGSPRSETAIIKPGAAKTFDQATGSSTVNCSTLAGGDGKFIGSATITSNEPIVASLMQLNTVDFRVLMGYNGFAAGSPTVNLPLVMANNNGFYTGFQIQNTGPGSTNVTVSYAPNTISNGFQPSNESCSLAMGASCTLLQNSGQWTSRYVGAATLTNDSSSNLVAIVNQVSLGGGGLGPFGTAYEGFNPASATSNVSAALIMSNNSGYYTGVQVQNVGDTACGSVTIDYSSNLAGAFNPANENFSLAAGASTSVIQNGSSPANGGINNWGTNRYIGSAEISAPGCSIVAIVNEVAFTAGDQFFTYNGFNR